MSDRVSKKDVTTTIIILIVIFLGIPLTLWAISSTRFNRVQERFEELVAPLLEESRELTQKVVDDINELNLTSLTRSSSYLSNPNWNFYDSSLQVQVPGPYSKIKNPIRESCETFIAELNKKTDEFHIESFSQCSFVFSLSDESYANASDYRLGKFDDPNDLQHLEELLASDEELPWSSHQDYRRSIHFFALISRDPDVFWQFRFFPSDR